MAKAPATEWGIPFMDSMVLAILEGRKTVTRRISPRWAKRKPGDRLWVREAWNVRGLAWAMRPRDAARVAAPDAWLYRATPPESWSHGWKPSIHMPRAASRLTLEVVSVTEEPAMGRRALTREPFPVPMVDDICEAPREGFDSRVEFVAAWQSMHGDYDGPVYRIEFRRLP